MDSLQWVDQTYVQKHQGEDPKNLRALFYPNLRLYATHGDTSKQKAPMDAAIAFLTRFGRRAAISLVIYMLSYLPIVGRFVLPAASFYTFNKALEPYFSRIHFDKRQKRLWFRDREGVLFGFGLGFYIFLKVPLLGVLIYGIAEASTAFLITKITDPPPPPAYSEKFMESQVRWTNKHEFLKLPLANLDEHNVKAERKEQNHARIGDLPGTLFFAIMGLNEIRTALKVDLKKPAAEQPGLHNRWHPDVPFNGTIKNGEVVKIECVDWTGGQIGNNDSADDMKNVDLTKVHYLSGPFEVETAEPGDVLVVEIQDVQPFQEQPWGFTGVFDKNNGGGFLDEIYPNAAKAIWDFEGIFCSSRHIPHIRFPGLIHPGILGCAPSQEILDEWNRREGELISTNTLDRIVAQPPEPQNVHAGSASEEIKAKVGKEGARTIPGRPEHGGNCDIKNLSRGSKTFLPVHVPGAKLSVGDLHFSQGDGEISFCGAIEMAGVITVKLTVMKNGMADLGMKSPMFLPGPVEPHYGPGRYLTFEGFSVDEKGKQHYLDATVAYRQTTLRCIEYLRRFGGSRFPRNFPQRFPFLMWGYRSRRTSADIAIHLGYSDYQVYLMLSCAPIQGHIAGLVDVSSSDPPGTSCTSHAKKDGSLFQIPNACTTLGLPMDIFDFDISPTAPAEKMDMGTCAFARRLKSLGLFKADASIIETKKYILLFAVD
ncbi:MAG: hypothetical protein LQ346_000257 [Caloplaca aetnensis]|nr:MAG: hypothetical protein LQ346_000257 [Caloplaca aetnensis]